MGSKGQWLLVVAVAAGVAGWQYRERLQALLRQPLPLVGAPVVAPAAPDVVYSWVDKNGVTHFEQDAGRGQRVVYDGKRITPLAPVDPGLVERVRQVSASDASAPGTGEAAAQGSEAGAAPAGSGGAAAPAGATGGLHGLRRELQEKARRMQAVRDAERDL